jgi:ABC-2 type transport system ATP-binding protein
MLVRLAFSLMLEVDADILLIDEVLAVGDAAFQQKCADAFHEMKEAGKTIILVTHDTAAAESYCHRAMLIDGGKIQHIGDPAEVGRHYLRLNFERGSDLGPADRHGEEESTAVRMLDAYLENEKGERTTSVEHGEEIHLRFELEAKEDLPGIDAGFILANADSIGVFQFGVKIGEGDSREVTSGERVTIETTLANPLAPGRYFIHCGLSRAHEGGVALYVKNAIEFVVYGGRRDHGIVFIEQTTKTTIEPEAGR